VGERDLFFAEALDDAEAVEAGHLNVEEDEVGFEVLDELEGFETVRGGGGDIDIGELFEEEGEFIAGEGFIIDEDGRNGLRGSGGAALHSDARIAGQGLG
jgi:hypothetical protein